MSAPTTDELIFDWAQAGPRRDAWPTHVMLDDETLRDGLQSPSVVDPPLETKVRLLHLMDELGIETANIGLPGAGPRQLESVTRLCREIADEGLSIQPNCAARTMMVDIQPIADVTQRTGVGIEACVFIGSSPIRQYAEEWDLEHILRHTVDAIDFAVGEGLDVMYVTEDTIRSSPEQLRVLFTAAIDHGAKRLCLCDTVGTAFPTGVWNLVLWVRGLLDELGADVGLDWHGHRDRGLSLANSLAAIVAGVGRVHGTALGIGERVGNTPMEQLLVNLRLLGVRKHDLSCLQDYVELASQATGVELPVNMPIAGRDAFRTATGVHAAAVVKALRKDEAWLADLVYSGVPASWIGRAQEIEVGPMSGGSNVRFVLGLHGIDATPTRIRAILDAAKDSDRLLTEDEILDLVR